MRGGIMFKSKYYILKLIDSSDAKIIGRKRLQKLVYIMKNKRFPIPQNFTYYHYGPYSQELNSTVSELTASGLLEETNTPQGYEYKLTEDGKAFINLLEKNKLVEKYEVDNKTKEIIKHIKKKEPSLLELTSTILFLQNYGESLEGAFSKALELKPHLKTHVKDTKKLLDELKNNILEEK